MINLLNNWKYIAIGVLLIIIIVLFFRLARIEKDNVSWQSKYAILENTVNASNEMARQQEADLRLREQEAAKAQAESQKRMDEIMKDKVPDDCQGIRDYGISKAVQFQFNWNNNIP